MDKIFRKYLGFLAMTLLAVVACACDSQPGNEDEPIPVQQPAKRTLLVYIAANNTLGMTYTDDDGVPYQYDLDDIDEMREGVLNHGLNGCRVIIYHHPRSLAATLYELGEDGELTEIKQYDQTEMAVDATRMDRVIADVQEAAPAHDYGLVLWSHGSGWIDPLNPGNDLPRPRSFGDETVNGRHYGMKVTTLADVLYGRGFSYIYFDCCNMNAIEVAYELRDVTNTIVGSTTELPGPGMPYELNLPLLLADEPDLVGAARNTYEYYYALGNRDYWCAMSVIGTAAVKDLAEATREIYTSAETAPLRSSVQSFVTPSSNSTLFDFEQYINAFEVDQALKDRWNRAFAEVVKYEAHTPRILSNGSFILLDRHCGLSTFIMESEADINRRGYESLDWYNDVASLLIHCF